MKIRKKLAFVIIIAVLLNLCGCEGIHKGIGRGDTSESGALFVSEAENEEEKTSEGASVSSRQPTYPFITRNCIYRLDFSGEHLIQTDLQGKKRNKFDLPEDSWCDYLRVSDNHICLDAV